ncbi:DUF3667 domain-containing protein [Sphingomicrobium aestuariivivum]|uniref:DUF3667 domain-containing protein n=1 Tax=Sphingomicrobium aestuariivivum TaxID=1582356 RepID=UPI001FD71065|nr:DUF3667 domain-containing protein [Sphingomicrobium aestuariivivum]MCJ8190796.1 DUF3667 domain-containing protein [Sphingomicrobium aestuariivivum]
MGGEEISAVGELAGGAGAARAVEPGHGEDGHGTPTHCLNCGCELQGDYCHCCGQRGEVHFTIGGLVHDIVHGVLHLDGKFWRTLPMLAWKPGQLTREYVAGKRARYISPIAFYLFTVVAMFALVVSADQVNVGDDVNLGAAVEPAASVEEQRERVEDLEQTLAEMEGDDYPGASGARAGVATSLAVARRQLEEMETGNTVIASDEDGDVKVTSNLSDDSEFLEPLRQGIEEAQENPALFFYKVQTKAYKLSWLLIPLSLPFMWLLFPFSRRHSLYKHAVFVTYSISFMMLLVLNIGLWTWLGAEFVGIVFAVFYAPFHLYRQLKGAYELGRLSALLRTTLLSIFAWMVLGIFIGLMFALGAWG